MVTMWSINGINVSNMDLLMDQNQKQIPEYEPTPYTFKTLDNGKKTAAELTSVAPPSWLLLDHTIAVIWLMFRSKSSIQQLSIEDLKWAYEFLKEIKNKKGEKPPDVKLCLKEIQDRLIYLYAKSTSLKAEDFDEIAAAFGEKIMEDPTTSSPNFYALTSIEPKRVDSKWDSVSVNGLSMSPTRGPPKNTLLNLFSDHPSKDLNLRKNSGTTKHKRIAMNCSKKTIPFLEKEPNIFEESEIPEDEDVEKYILSLFNEEKKDDLQSKAGVKSLIPMTKKKTPTTSLFEIISSQGSTIDVPKKEKTSKKVHCYAEMRSLKFQKSMKVQDTNGEEAAYANLKAEIRRLTINPNVSRTEIMKFLKEWRSEQVDRLNNELKRLNSIEEFMKSISKDGIESNLRMNPKLKELETTSSSYSLSKTFLP